MKLASEDVIRDLAPNYELRAAINIGNPVLAQKSHDTGQTIGVSVDLALELGRRLQVAVKLITFETAGKVVDTANRNVWDVAFLAIDTARMKDVDFTKPYLNIEATYLVHMDSQFYSPADVDRPNVRIAVGRGSAYELHLSRALKFAQLIKCENSSKALDFFRENGLEAAAGIRQPNLSYVKRHPQFRVIDQCCAVIEQAMATPMGKSCGNLYLQSFIYEMKTSGFIASALGRSGQSEACGALIE